MLSSLILKNQERYVESLKTKFYESLNHHDKIEARSFLKDWTRESIKLDKMLDFYYFNKEV
jgi:hypothetical protein